MKNPLTSLHRLACGACGHYWEEDGKCGLCGEENHKPFKSDWPENVPRGLQYQWVIDCDCGRGILIPKCVLTLECPQCKAFIEVGPERYIITRNPLKI